MADRYHKTFLSWPPEFEQLSYDSQAFSFYVRGRHIEPDGAIAIVKPGEKIYQAIARTYGIASKKRRRFDKIVTELFMYGFLALHGDRVVVPHWEAQRTWRKGSPPLLRCEPDRATLTRLAHESATKLLEHLLRTSPTLVEDFSDTSPTLVEDFSDTSSESTSRNHSTSLGQNGSEPVGSARIGSASPPAIGNPKARATDSPTAATPPGSDGDPLTADTPHGESSPHGIPPDIELAPIVDTEEDVDADREIYLGDYHDPDEAEPDAAEQSW